MCLFFSSLLRSPPTSREDATRTPGVEKNTLPVPCLPRFSKSLIFVAIYIVFGRSDPIKGALKKQGFRLAFSFILGWFLDVFWTPLGVSWAFRRGETLLSNRNERGA